MGYRALALLCALAGCSSGGGGGGLTAAQLEIVDCTRLTVTDVVRVLGGIERVLAGDVARTPLGGNDYGYELAFDGTTMRGQVTYPRDPAEGIPLDEDVVVTFSLEGPLAGSGNATFRFASAREATMRGGATLRNELGCSASLIFLPALPLRVVFREPIAGPAPAAEVFGLRIFGPIDVNLTAFERTVFAGDVEIAEGMQDALLDGALDDEPFRLVFALFPDAAARVQLAACVTALFEMRAALYDILLGRTEAIDAAGADLTALPETPGFTVDPVSPSNATYTLDAAQFGSFFTAGTIRGSVRLTRVNLETTAFWSWRIQAEAGGDSVFGQSARFYEIAVGQGVRSSGAGSLGRPGCAGTFEEDGILTVRAVVGPHTLAVDFEGPLPAAARIDGIPVPLDSVFPP